MQCPTGTDLKIITILKFQNRVENKRIHSTKALFLRFSSGSPLAVCGPLHAQKWPVEDSRNPKILITTKAVERHVGYHIDFKVNTKVKVTRRTEQEPLFALVPGANNHAISPFKTFIAYIYTHGKHKILKILLPSGPELSVPEWNSILCASK